ncbi:hypothetical protein, partial [Vibrio parahaemolyticus]|uniref:hypothetical protein n=1 Tax=Vibrio parahaemolyticus TaxID=670 RepID=UPI002111DAAC
MKKKIDSPQKSLIKKSTKPKIEPPKAYSPSKKKKDAKKKDSKKYTFSPEKIQKLPAETQADYKARFNFTVMALPEQKESLDP